MLRAAVAINEKERDTSSLIQTGQTYEHYSGKKYVVLMVGRHSEDYMLHVVYKGLYIDEQFGSEPIWLRPLAMFVEDVTINGKRVPRFMLVDKKGKDNI